MPITFGGDIPSSTERVLTKSYSLNQALRDVLGNAGFPLRSLVELYGPKGCIAKDMFIRYEIRDNSGKRQNHKGGTIEHLYRRFNRLNTKGLGYYQRDSTKDSIFYVPSIDDRGLIYQNRVADVVYSGVKDTFKVTLKSGEFVICTADHELFASQSYNIPEYIPLYDLKIGDTLFIHNNTHYKVDDQEKLKYKESTVKYHPFGVLKKINGHTYYRIRYSHLVYEANLNGIDIDTYRECLNTWDTSAIENSFIFVDSTKYDIHHKDENTRNDEPENLEKKKKKEHYRSHALKTNSIFSRRIVVPSKIVSIEFHSTQDVYDIKCFAPLHNFVANGVVVHNCGKTSFALSIMGTVAKEKNKGITLLDFEGQENSTISNILEGTGFDGEVNFVRNRGKERPEDTVERFCDRMFDLHNKAYENPDVGLMDSIGAFRPMAELEGKIGDANMGLKAREMGQISSRFLRSLQLSQSPGTIWMTNHEHPNMSIGFGNPLPITSGGETKKYLSQIRIRLTDAYVKKESIKTANFSGQVKFDGSWLIEGKVNENRFGISDQKFYVYMVGGEGIHAGLTSVIECLIYGYAESSAQMLKESATISMDGKSYGKMGKLIRDRNSDPEMFIPFKNALLSNSNVEEE